MISFRKTIRAYGALMEASRSSPGYSVALEETSRNFLFDPEFGEAMDLLPTEAHEEMLNLFAAFAMTDPRRSVDHSLFALLGAVIASRAVLRARGEEIQE